MPDQNLKEFSVCAVVSRVKDRPRRALADAKTEANAAPQFLPPHPFNLQLETRRVTSGLSFSRCERSGNFRILGALDLECFIQSFDAEQVPSHVSLTEHLREPHRHRHACTCARIDCFQYCDIVASFELFAKLLNPLRR